MVNVTGNSASGRGGGIYVQNNSVSIDVSGGGNVTLSNNRALGGNGGAIDEDSQSVLIGSAGSTVVITGNSATANGGAIFSQNNTINGKSQRHVSDNMPWAAMAAAR